MSVSEGTMRHRLFRAVTACGAGAFVASAAGVARAEDAVTAAQAFLRDNYFDIALIVPPLTLLLLLAQPGKHDGWVWALVGVNGAVYATSLFSRVCFWIDENNNYQGGPLSDTCLWISTVLVAHLLYQTIRVFHIHRRRENLVPLLVLLVIAGGVALDYNIGAVEKAPAAPAKE